MNTVGVKGPSIEDNLLWKTTFGGEDNFRWKTILHEA